MNYLVVGVGNHTDGPDVHSARAVAVSAGRGHVLTDDTPRASDSGIVEKEAPLHRHVGKSFGPADRHADLTGQFCERGGKAPLRGEQINRLDKSGLTRGERRRDGGHGRPSWVCCESRQRADDSLSPTIHHPVKIHEGVWRTYVSFKKNSPR